MATSRRMKFKIGDIVRIPLPDGRFAFARIFNSTFGIYNLISSEPLSSKAVKDAEMSFYMACNEGAVKSGEWPVIGHEDFQSPDDAWSPPQATMYFKEKNEWTMGGIPRINFRGQTLVASLEQVRGLDVMSVCHRPELLIKVIIDRVINGNHAAYKVREP